MDRESMKLERDAQEVMLNKEYREQIPLMRSSFYILPRALCSV